ncbi:glycosyltransferase family 2 protein [Gryllotalpicola koreensis]|uniref:Glycosyltransferase n=1 Tax=Gryllotalpicola koreensis TaxID=993086 RepID=A0ABP7ZPE1_9MICO
MIDTKRRVGIADPLPRVSVVIPCYNYARYLPDAVRSALEQPGVDVDVVIIDDASTDDSVAVAKAFAERDERVRLVQHPANRGHVETANEALGLATADFLVKLDADDLLTPGSLARSVALLTAHPETAFCYGHPVEFTGPPPRSDFGTLRGWSVWRGDDWIERVLRRSRCPIRQPEVMMRRAALDAAGGYRAQLRWAEDFNLLLRLAHSGAVGRVNGTVQGLYRVHEASFQRSHEDVALRDLSARIAAIELFFAESGADRRVLNLSLSALAVDARRLAADASSRGEDSVALEEIAEQLDHRTGVDSASSLLAGRGRFARFVRDVDERVRWRLWRRRGY